MPPNGVFVSRAAADLRSAKRHRCSAMRDVFLSRCAKTGWQTSARATLLEGRLSVEHLGAHPSGGLYLSGLRWRHTRLSWSPPPPLRCCTASSTARYWPVPSVLPELLGTPSFPPGAVPYYAVPTTASARLPPWIEGRQAPVKRTRLQSGVGLSLPIASCGGKSCGSPPRPPSDHRSDSP